MRKEILALLTAKFGGVRNDVLNGLARAIALQVSSVDEAKTVVEKLTDAQVSDYAKEVRADVDKEVSESNKTFEANLRKKYDFAEKGKTAPKVEPGNDGNGGNPTDIADLIAKAVETAMKPVQEKLAGYETANLAKNRLQSLTEKLNECKDEMFKAQALKNFRRMQFESDDEFNNYIEETVADIEKANQNVADMALRNSGGSPLFAEKAETGISQGVASYIEANKPGNDQFSGKQL